MKLPALHPASCLLTRRQWCARTLAAVAGSGSVHNAFAAAALSLPPPDVKFVLSELLVWAARVNGQEMHFDHPREEQAAAFKALGRDAARVLKVAGNKEGHLLMVDVARGTLTMRTVSPADDDRGINLHLAIFPFASKSPKWMYPPSAGGEIPAHPSALIAVSTEDSEGDVETRAFQLYQYGHLGNRTVFSAAKGLGDFMNQPPEAALCLPLGDASMAVETQADAARKTALKELEQAWSEESSFKALRGRLLNEEAATPQWSAQHSPTPNSSLIVQPFWINDGGSDMAADWASPTGTAKPELLRPLFKLVRALRYEWDAPTGEFRYKDTVPRPDDVEFLERETGEKA